MTSLAEDVAALMAVGHPLERATELAVADRARNSSQPALEEGALRAIIRSEVQAVTGTFSPVSGLRTPSGFKWNLSGFTTPPRSSEDSYGRYKKYAEALQAALKKINWRYSLKFDRDLGILDFIEGNNNDSPPHSLHIRDADHLKNVYCALSIQYFGDVRAWAQAFNNDEFQSAAGVPTP